MSQKKVTTESARCNEKNQLRELEGTMSMWRERDRLSKARHTSLESESEALLRKEQIEHPWLRRECKSLNLKSY